VILGKGRKGSIMLLFRRALEFGKNIELAESVGLENEGPALTLMSAGDLGDMQKVHEVEITLTNLL